ncbi:tryptophan synthase subunit beta [Natrarchaeobius halalkaliphilus]|uniref:Tryptophan synthase beta chain n=1 Tax=Natrarchaeobius halalkaliphilus TaxID=1679091 RepID=A0A3N6LHP9_9EURY|nr:tryptophan synthase subunit beta [Natrarchaeobius halalkaliphilus]RQG86704.1 tryptophan synthase subunit beta [Natrarchaeobius halalkaliphilus]
MVRDGSPQTFGQFGGRYAPDELEEVLEDLATEYDHLKDDEEFREELDELLRNFAGRPTPLYHASSLSEEYGATIYFKREDLVHGGAHKLNNALGQALLAKHAGKERLIAETGAGQHGTATSFVGAHTGLETEIYQGKKDAERQRMNVFRMEQMGATVNKVTRGGSGLADAVDAAMEDLIKNNENTHYLVGSVVGPDPWPRMVRDFQSVIGEEAREQILEQEGKLPDAAVACVGGGSNAIGLFHPFFDDSEVDFYGAEAAGKGLDTNQHAAPLSEGKEEVYQGMRTRVIDDDVEVHSIAAGLDYPGVGPEHANYQELDRCSYRGIVDEDALQAFQDLCKYEGIVPALESSHAVALAKELAAEMDEDDVLLVNLSGRGDKDVEKIAEEYLQD